MTKRYGVKLRSVHFDSVYPALYVSQFRHVRAKSYEKRNEITRTYVRAYVSAVSVDVTYARVVKGRLRSKEVTCSR